jgi:hypothetical protein
MRIRSVVARGRQLLRARDDVVAGSSFERWILNHSTFTFDDRRIVADRLASLR